MPARLGQWAAGGSRAASSAQVPARLGGREIGVIDQTEMRKVRRFLRVVERIWNVTLLVNILAFNLTCVHGGFGFSGTEMCRPLTYGGGNACGFQY